LNKRANSLAHYLRDVRGVRAGSVVGVFLRRGYLMVLAHLGIMKAGAAYLPIDPAYPRDRVQYMLNDSQSQVGCILSIHDICFIGWDFDSRSVSQLLQFQVLISQESVASSLRDDGGDAKSDADNGLTQHVILLDKEWSSIRNSPNQNPRGTVQVCLMLSWHLFILVQLKINLLALFAHIRVLSWLILCTRVVALASPRVWQSTTSRSPPCHSGMLASTSTHQPIAPLRFNACFFVVHPFI
jgi:hypothetical protein